METTMKKKQIQFRNRITKIAVPVILFFACQLYASTGSGQTIERLTPFIGKWKTLSLFPESGERVSGNIEYSWVLGKNWVKVEFKGNHPERDYWEAHAMIRFDRMKNYYLSYDFFNTSDPILMIGRWISPDTIRFEFQDEEQHWGIDYTVRQDGTIYQENWQIMTDHQKKITLQTEYQKSRK